MNEISYLKKEGKVIVFMSLHFKICLVNAHVAYFKVQECTCCESVCTLVTKSVGVL